MQRAAGLLRAGLRRAVAPLPDAERGLLPGLVVGDTSRLDPGLREDFRTVGLTHLTAVSGTNVAIVTGAVLLLARRLGLGLRAGPVLAAVALAGFVVLARPSPSVLRAAVMGVVGLLALSSGNRTAAMPALAAAVVVLVLWDPDLAATPGFALSVLATGGLLVLAPGWRAALARRMPGWLADALAVPLQRRSPADRSSWRSRPRSGCCRCRRTCWPSRRWPRPRSTGVAAALLAPVSLPAAQAVAWLGWPPTAWLVLVGSHRRAAARCERRLAVRCPRGAAARRADRWRPCLPCGHRLGRRLVAAGTAGVAVATTAAGAGPSGVAAAATGSSSPATSARVTRWCWPRARGRRSSSTPVPTPRWSTVPVAARRATRCRSCC